MLYTVVPLERIYSDMRGRQKEQVKAAEEQEEYKEIQLKHGHMITRREGEGYVIERVISTDMADYLNMEYTPGKSYFQSPKK